MQFLRETMNLVDAFIWGRRGFRTWILECDAGIQKEAVIGPIIRCILFPRATSQADMFACPFGDCREGQIPRSSAALQV